MSEIISLTQLVTNVVSASALLNSLGVDTAGPETYLHTFQEEFSRYFEISVPHSFDRIGLMTRGRDEAFSERLTGWLHEVASPEDAQTFEASVARLGHKHTFIKAVFARHEAPRPGYYFRRRLMRTEALGFLEAEGLVPGSLSLLRSAAEVLEKSSTAFIARRVVQDGPDLLKVYFTQYLPDGDQVVSKRLLTLARLLGVKEEHHRGIRACVQALAEVGGATIFVALGFEPDPIPELKLYFEAVPPPALLATLDALKIICGRQETTSLPTLLGVLEGLLSAERVDYAGFRFGSPRPEATFYYYREQVRA